MASMLGTLLGSETEMKILRRTRGGWEKGQGEDRRLLGEGWGLGTSPQGVTSVLLVAERGLP